MVPKIPLVGFRRRELIPGLDREGRFGQAEDLSRGSPASDNLLDVTLGQPGEVPLHGGLVR